MKKIISLFHRNYGGDRLVRNEVVPGAEWVIAGEGVATEKYDGTCCLVRCGKLFRRYDAKKGKMPPSNFEPAQDPDPVTGHWPGWVPVGDGPEDKWHREAFGDGTMGDGTYELVGPKIQRNPYGWANHVLLTHGFRLPHDPPRDYVGIKEYLSNYFIEGIVWHHPDGHMVKIK